MDFSPLYPAIRQQIMGQAPPDWPDLRSLLADYVERPFDGLVVLPLASCAAADGDPAEAVPVAAAWLVLNISMRILDDLQDTDRPTGLWAEVGTARAYNFSASLYTLAYLLLEDHPVRPTLPHTALRLAAGQDRDLKGDIRSLDDYWQMIAGKNAEAFAWACRSGARCATTQPDILHACEAYGLHTGYLLQFFDDFQGVWQPDGAGDLAQGKITLPLIYGLNADHPRREELRQLVEQTGVQEAAEEIRRLLDAMDAREFVVWAALKERKAALQALRRCPGDTSTLVDYVTGVFARLDLILDTPRPEEG